MLDAILRSVSEKNFIQIDFLKILVLKSYGFNTEPYRFVDAAIVGTTDDDSGGNGAAATPQVDLFTTIN